MNTDFRLLLHSMPDGTSVYKIHEVTFSNEGEVLQISAPILPQHSSAETLTHILIHMLGALTKPVLDARTVLSTDINNSVDDALALMQPRKNT